MREAIGSAFKCGIHNRYGTREVGDIACERIPGEGLDVNFPLHYVEVVDEKGDPVDEGKEGRILVTSLSNFAMPLLRYEIGDLAVPSEIADGDMRHILQLETVTGRVGDSLVTADDQIISTVYFIHSIGVLLEADWIEKFQVVQHATDSVEVLVVVADGISLTDGEQGVQEIRARVKNVMGEDCSVEVTEVDDIERSDSGKYRYTKSNVDTY
jgi:phenylacetate-CoA ligase